MEHLGLSARLTNAIVRTNNIIELDFVLHNGSSVLIRLAERRKSRGAHQRDQWQFRVIDAQGTAHELRHLPDTPSVNHLTTLAIATSEDQITRCRLVYSTAGNSEDSPVTFAHIVVDCACPESGFGAFPIAVTGTSTASKHEHVAECRDDLGGQNSDGAVGDWKVVRPPASRRHMPHEASHGRLLLSSPFSAVSCPHEQTTDCGEKPSGLGIEGGDVLVVPMRGVDETALLRRLSQG